MNRRDMIIVAALINAGLLIVLFITAVKSDNIEEKSSLTSLHKPNLKLEAAPMKPAKVSFKEDQIDQVINDYSAKIVEKEKTEIKTLPLPILTPQPKATKSETVVSSPVKSPSEEFLILTIEKGDVLERIAKQNGISVEEIMQLNKLSNVHLKVGQVLKLPKHSSKKIVQKTVQTEDQFYIVKGGDNPWTIAQKNGMQVDELLQLNDMNEEKAKRLRPGDKLRIK